MNKYLVTLHIQGQRVKTAVEAASAIHARLLCQYQFGMGCIAVPPKLIEHDGYDEAELEQLMDSWPDTIKPIGPKPPKPAAIKPTKPPSPEQMRITQLKANVDRQREVLQRERDHQKRQRAAERMRANFGGH